LPATCSAWTNGQSGNASTNEAGECASPPYSTHDWVADRALALLPVEEREWIGPHKALYLLGTEAPDNKHIPDACGAPGNGYDDHSKGHSVEWASDWSGFATRPDGRLKDRAAFRARQEYNKAVSAFQRGERDAAAYYLGAMAHYIGDVAQYGHSVPFEEHHSPYEQWVARRTRAFSSDVFDSYVEGDGFRRRTAYTAVKRISKVTARGQGEILSARRMDPMYDDKKDNQEYLDSVGHSLNYGINELADVLHTFWLKVASEIE
jgi:hypothetical protein